MKFLGQVRLVSPRMGQLDQSFNINASSPGVINYGNPGGTTVNPGVTPPDTYGQPSPGGGQIANAGGALCYLCSNGNPSENQTVTGTAARDALKNKGFVCSQVDCTGFTGYGNAMSTQGQTSGFQGQDLIPTSGAESFTSFPGAGQGFGFGGEGGFGMMGRRLGPVRLGQFGQSFNINAQSPGVEQAGNNPYNYNAQSFQQQGMYNSYGQPENGELTPEQQILNAQRQQNMRAGQGAPGTNPFGGYGYGGGSGMMGRRIRLVSGLGRRALSAS